MGIKSATACKASGELTSMQQVFNEPSGGALSNETSSPSTLQDQGTPPPTWAPVPSPTPSPTTPRTRSSSRLLPWYLERTLCNSGAHAFFSVATTYSRRLQHCRLPEPGLGPQAAHLPTTEMLSGGLGFSGMFSCWSGSEMLTLMSSTLSKKHWKTPSQLKATNKETPVDQGTGNPCRFLINHHSLPFICFILCESCWGDRRTGVL